MGLFKFLKEKFGKKKETNDVENESVNNEVAEEVFVSKVEEEPQEVLPNDEISESTEEEKIVEPEIKEEKTLEAQPQQVIFEEQKIKGKKIEVSVEEKYVEPKVEIVEEKPVEEKVTIEEKHVEEYPKNIVNDVKVEKSVEVKPIKSEETKKTKTYVKGMEKSRHNFADKIEKLSKKYKKVNQEYFEQLEEILIEADVGVNLTLKVIDDVITESKEKKIDNAEEINELVIDRLFEGYMNSGEKVGSDIRFQTEGPTVLLVAGVNGVGKTTTIAKLANRYIKQGKKVMLCAADTFRAGAIEQLTIWSERLGCPIVVGKPESDPASVAFEGAKRAKLENVDLLIVDTAGRLQNKINLMNELAKISRVISKEIPDSPHEVFLVIDATTGQNGVVQAKQFLDCIKLTGIVITKMDGTSKGGIILAIRDELGIPVRFIGLGESMDDLQEFDLEKYLVGLLIGDFDE